MIAQDEASSAVWGMPGRVTQAGIAEATVPLQGLAGALMERVPAAVPGVQRRSTSDQAGGFPQGEVKYAVL